MGIFVNSLGDIVATQPGYVGLKLVAYDDETGNNGDVAENIARRLRQILGVTDTVWFAAYHNNRISPVMHSPADAEKWLTDYKAPSMRAEFEILERKGSEFEVAYTDSPA